MAAAAGNRRERVRSSEVHEALHERRVELVAALADIAADRHHFAAVVFLEPGNDYRGIQAARVSQGNLLRFVHMKLIIPTS